MNQNNNFANLTQQLNNMNIQQNNNMGGLYNMNMNINNNINMSNMDNMNMNNNMNNLNYNMNQQSQNNFTFQQPVQNNQFNFNVNQPSNNNIGGDDDFNEVVEEDIKRE